jgi:hypothetical protein
MDPQIMKTAGMVIGIVIACPLFYACLKAAAFFGAMKTTVDGVVKSLTGLSQTLTDFTAKVTDDLSGHGNRLTAVETKVESIERREEGERRAAPSPTGEPFDRRRLV